MDTILNVASLCLLSFPMTSLVAALYIALLLGFIIIIITRSTHVESFTVTKNPYFGLKYHLPWNTNVFCTWIGAADVTVFLFAEWSTVISTYLRMKKWDRVSRSSPTGRPIHSCTYPANWLVDWTLSRQARSITFRFFCYFCTKLCDSHI